MKTPKEDPKDKEARLRERRTAELERSRATQTQAKGLTGDVRRTYGNQVSMFGMSAARPAAKAPAFTAPSTRPRDIRMGERN